MDIAKYKSAMFSFSWIVILRICQDHLDNENYREVDLINKAFDEYEKDFGFKIPRFFNNEAIELYESFLKEYNLTKTHVLTLIYDNVEPARLFLYGDTTNINFTYEKE